jgi:hypothetical protein
MDILAGNTGDGGGGGAGLVFAIIIGLVFAVAQIAGMWKMFQKAGIEGWWAIIPIANIYHFVKLSGKEWWWFLVYFVPCIFIVALIVVNLAVAVRFGKSVGYAIGMIILPVIFYPLLGFGDAEYQPAPAV